MLEEESLWTLVRENMDASRRWIEGTYGRQSTLEGGNLWASVDADGRRSYLCRSGYVNRRYIVTTNVHHIDA